MPTLLILGAGFSRPAGFPLGRELFPKIEELANARNLYESTIVPDIERYIHYQAAANGNLDSPIDLEDFLAFLDIEHFLWLQGSETWMEEGNRSQMVIRNLISLALYEALESIEPGVMDFYRDFARNLRPGDLIITFNYDTLVEVCLNDLGIPFRLVPNRFKSVNEWGGTLEYPEKEVIVLKVHGSMDWFDRGRYDQWARERHVMGLPDPPRHPVFNDPQKCNPAAIVDGPYFPDSPLLTINRATNLAPYFLEATFLLEAPLLVAPSSVKLAYLNPIKEFWRGFAREGEGFTRMGIIGFSLSRYDDYVRQPLYHLVTNYQATNATILGNPKAPLVMIDCRSDEKAQAEYRSTYRFVDWANAQVSFDGFDSASLALVFPR